MVEYVYALHDFEPQNEDEISFVAGERIEVIEKDDAYGDGWWTGRNLAGHEGIFPKDYTTPAGPLIPDLRTPTGTSNFNIHNGVSTGSGSGFHGSGYGSTLHPLTEENESDTAQGPGGLSVPNGIAQGGGHVMAATMTDIQQAIDQLGVRRANSAMTDDGRSMSFASTRDDRTSIYEPDGTQTRTYEDGRSVRDSIWDEPGVTPGGTLRMTMNEEWHRNARRRLFEKVDQIDMERRREEEEDGGPHDRNYHRPPLDVEFSDESEDEDGHHDHHHHHHHHHHQPHNDLHHRLEHDDSIPSTLPSTFQDHSTASLSYGKEDASADADISTSTTTGAKHLTDSPAKADGPTLAVDVDQKGDIREATPTINVKEIVEEKREKTVTPIPEPSFQAPPVDPVKDIPPNRTQDKFHSNPPVSQPSIAESSSLSVHAPKDVPSASAAPPSISSNTQVETVKSISPISPVPSAASYISFLPSPTNASFNTAPNNVSMSQVASTIPKPSPLEAPIVPRIYEEQGEVTTAPSSGVDQSGTSVGPGNASIISSITSTSLAPPSSVAPSQASPQTKKTPPSEWTVDQVVEWIRSKGFDEGVCGKFAEHEITGDILLEFDANMLKEIDIIAFGKRMKIANAISELRRPPSFESSDAASLKPQSLSQFSLVGQQPTYHHPPQTVLPGFAPSVSMPNIGVSHGHTLSQSTQGYNASVSSASFSMNSPGIFGVLQAQNPQNQGQLFNSPGNYSPNLFPNAPGQNELPSGYDQMPENSKQLNAPHVHARVDSDPGVGAMGDAARMIMAMNGYSIPDKAATVGHSAGKDKTRPSSLALSPSDGILSKRGIIPVTEEDDRAAMSDSDIRKRKEVMSLDSAASHNPPDTPRSDTPSQTSARPRSSLDARPSERLSFFSAMRNRKPAPRYSSDHSGSELGSPNVSQTERQTTYSKLYLAGATKPPRVPKAKEQREKEKKEKEEKARAHRENKEKGKGKEEVPEPEKDGGAGVLRKRTLSGDPRTPGSAAPDTVTTPRVNNGVVTLRPGENVLHQFNEILGEADHSGFMLKKGERYNTWKSRFFFLKGTHLYYLRSKQETRIKGYINIKGYKIIADEATHPGRYGFRIIHDTQKPHFFSSEDQIVIRDWMKALMKATIDRDFARPVISSCNIPTIPLAVAQTMNPAPRPPSPRTIAAAQMASRQADSSGLLSRDTKMLMGIAEGSAVLGATPTSPAPQRPSREMRRPSIANRSEGPKPSGSNAALIQWINSLLPDQTPQATDFSTSLSSGLILFRLAESIKYGRELATVRLRSPSPDDPIVPDKLFDDGDERIDGLMKLFDFLVDNDVKLSGISMADVKQGRSEKIIALVQSMKQWHERREAIAKSVGVGGVAGLRTWIHG
ncbi:polar growth protein [Serendipita sp. 396]|nr:polar growth protein [Serendipita sp. 396]KAG8798541.1 polar growth protein [Serendipita sp. 398]